MTPESLIVQHRLEPHPFEGWWRPTSRAPGEYLEGLQLFRAMDEAGWHRFPSAITYSLVEGGPMVISLSPDGCQAEARRLVAEGDSINVEQAALRALSCLGSVALLRLTIRPDCALTDRELMPDDWYPQG